MRSRLLPLFLAAAPLFAWPNGYTYRRMVRVNAGSMASSQSDFPGYLKAIVPDWATTSGGGAIQHTCAQGHGGHNAVIPCDLIFTSDADGMALLNWEFESYDAATGAAAIWLRWPVIGDGMVVYAWYGNPAVAASQNQPDSVWAGFKGVYHFSGGNSVNLQDSSANGNDLSSAVAVNSASGPLDSAMSLDGATQFLSRNAALVADRPFTISAWIRYTTALAPGSYGRTEIFAQDTNPASDPNRIMFGVKNTWTGSAFSDELSFYGFYAEGNAPAPLSRNTWTHAVVTVDSGGTVRIYTNGSEAVVGNMAGGQLSAARTQLGANNGATFLGGLVDEVQISGVARSKDWIAGQYANQSMPSSFFSISPAITQNGRGSGGLILQ